MEIKLLKMAWGATIVAEVEYSEEKGDYVVWRPIEVVPMPAVMGGESGAILMAFILGAKPENFTINEKWIVCVTEPKEDLVSEYRKRFGSGLVVPPKPGILLR